MRFVSFAAPLALVAGMGAFAACHSSSTSSNATTAGPTARFALGDGSAPPAYLAVPFPSDAYLGADGAIVNPLPGLDVVVPNGSSYVSTGLGMLDGFSRLAAASFVVDDPTGDKLEDGNAYAKIDGTTLPVAEDECTKATSSVYLVDLAPSDPSKAILPCRAGLHDDTPKSLTPPVISVGPPRGYLLDEGHEYAAVITSRVKDVSGRAIAASGDMRAVASGNAPGAMGAIYNKAYATVAAALGPSLAGDGASIVAIAPYKTMTKSHELFAMRDALESAPVPKLAWDAAAMAPMGTSRFAAPVTGKLPAGFTASLDDWLGVTTAKLPDGSDDPSANLPVRAHDAIAAVGTAVFQAISYLPETGGGYTDAKYHVFQLGSDGLPVAQPPVKIWVSFVVPTAPEPAGGYPVVILQHGLSGSRLYLMSLANVFARRGWMVAAIDSVTFGARAPEAMYHVDQIDTWSGAPGAKYQGPDGFADPVDGQGNPNASTGATNGSFDFFGGLENIPAVRDQFRQAAFDTAQLVRVLRAGPDLSPLATGGAAPTIDPERIVYVGDSLGGMEGTIAAAIEPRVKAWMLNVAGGSLFPELTMHSPTVGDQVAIAAALNFDLSGDRLDVFHPFIQVMQSVIEPGDPAIYAPYVVMHPQPLGGAPTTARNLLQIEALYDEIVPNEANEALMRAGEWALATPNVGSNAEAWDPAKAASNPRVTPLPQVAPDSSGAIHDTPIAGVTAVTIQCDPCGHGEDLTSHTLSHDFRIPYFDGDGRPDYKAQRPGFPVDGPYLALQATVTGFLDDALNGRVPRVAGWPAPVRDFDGDGNPDTTDPDPSDPSVH